MKVNNVKSKHYRQGKVPTVKNVRRFLNSLRKRVQQKGSKFYKKRRTVASKRIDAQADKYHISDTITSKYWKLKGICILIGVER